MRTALALVALLAGCATEPAATPDPALDHVATGALEPWLPATPLPVARANHCSAVIDDTLLVIGGNHQADGDFVKTADIHAGRVAADGTITWQLAGRAPSPVTECTATTDGRRLYLLDGLYDRDSDARQVLTADLDAAGQLSAFTSITTLPERTLSSEATIHDGALLLMATVLPADGDRTVTHRTALPSTSAWTTDDWQIGFRAQAQYAFADRLAFTLGGYTGAPGNPVSADVFVAALGPGGAIAGARPTTPLPTPIAFGEAVTVDAWLFVAGGRAQIFGAPGTATVLAAPITDAGDLGPWRAVASLPVPRTNHELAVVGDYLVLTGGATSGPGDTTVLVARVRFPPDSSP